MYASDDDVDLPMQEREQEVFETVPDWGEYLPTQLYHDVDDKNKAQLAVLLCEEKLRCNAQDMHGLHGGLTLLSAEQALVTPTTTSHEEEFVQISGWGNVTQLSSGLGRPGKSDRASGLCKSDLPTDLHLRVVCCEAEELQLGASPHRIRELEQCAYVSGISAEADGPHRRGAEIKVRGPECCSRYSSIVELEEVVDESIRASRMYEIEKIYDARAIKEPPQQRPRLVGAVAEDTALNNARYEHQPLYENTSDSQAYGNWCGMTHPAVKVMEDGSSKDTFQLDDIYCGGGFGLQDDRTTVSKYVLEGPIICTDIVIQMWLEEIKDWPDVVANCWPINGSTTDELGTSVWIRVSAPVFERTRDVYVCLVDCLVIDGGLEQCDVEDIPMPYMSCIDENGSVTSLNFCTGAPLPADQAAALAVGQQTYHVMCGVQITLQSWQCDVIPRDLTIRARTTPEVHCCETEVCQHGSIDCTVDGMTSDPSDTDRCAHQPNGAPTLPQQHDSPATVASDSVQADPREKLLWIHHGGDPGQCSLIRCRSCRSTVLRASMVGWCRNCCTVVGAARLRATGIWRPTLTHPWRHVICAEDLMTSAHHANALRAGSLLHRREQSQLLHHRQDCQLYQACQLV